MVHKQILHELYEELEFLKHDGNPADRQAYDGIEKAIFPIVAAARQRAIASGKPIPASLRSAITATDKRLVEKQEEMRFAAAQKQTPTPMTPQKKPMMPAAAPVMTPPPVSNRRGFKRAYSNNIRDWI